VSTRALSLGTRVALRPREAAEIPGVCERTLRQRLFVAAKVLPRKLGLSKAGELDRSGGL
jgi:hypothetical protein